RESEVGEILDRFLAQVMVDAKDRLFGEARVQRRVERACGSEVAAERFFDDDPGALGARGAAQLLDDLRKGVGRDREVVQWPAPILQRLSQSSVGRGVSIVALEIMQQRSQGLERALAAGAAHVVAYV